MVGVLTILAKSKVKKMFSEKSKRYLLFQNIISILGAFLIFSLGVIMFLGVYVR